jgi:hypothetical protein
MAKVRCRPLNNAGAEGKPVNFTVSSNGNAVAKPAVAAPITTTSASAPASAPMPASTTGSAANATALSASAAASAPPAVNAKAKGKAAVNAIVARIKTAAKTATTQTDLLAFNKLIGEYDNALKAVKGDAKPTPIIGSGVYDIPTAVQASAAAIEAAATKNMAGGRRKTHRKKHSMRSKRHCKTHKKHGGKRSTKHHKKHGKTRGKRSKTHKKRHHKKH